MSTYIMSRLLRASDDAVVHQIHLDDKTNLNYSRAYMMDISTGIVTELGAIQIKNLMINSNTIINARIKGFSTYTLIECIGRDIIISTENSVIVYKSIDKRQGITYVSAWHKGFYYTGIRKMYGEYCELLELLHERDGDLYYVDPLIGIRPAVLENGLEVSKNEFLRRIVLK